jgi:UDP-N-acetylmuramoyl-tripeptide--D-alanyl-D-alanine ligase
MTPASFNTSMGVTIAIRNYLKPLHQVFICEMGADKVNEINFLTKFVENQYGLVTTIGPQHLNTFKTIENIAHEKMKMIENLPAGGVGFMNKDNDYIRNYPLKNPCKKVYYGIEQEDVDYRAVDIKYSPQGSEFVVLTANGERHQFQTRLLGEHNIMNILASIAIGIEMGIQWNQLKKAVKKVKYVEHRLEVKKINGYTFIDNAFNSNPVSAKVSLDILSGMPGKRVIITPGMIELGELEEEENRNFGRQMLGKVDKVILVGINRTKPIQEGLKETSFPTEDIVIVKTVKEAFDYVYNNMSKEDTMLIENDLPDVFNN